MKLTTKALAIINKPAIRRELSGVLQCTEQSIIRYIHKNKLNGKLTTTSVILKIKKLTKLEDAEIVE